MNLASMADDQAWLKHAMNELRRVKTEIEAHYNQRVYLSDPWAVAGMVAAGVNPDSVIDGWESMRDNPPEIMPTVPELGVAGERGKVPAQIAEAREALHRTLSKSYHNQTRDRMRGDTSAHAWYDEPTRMEQ